MGRPEGYAVIVRQGETQVFESLKTHSRELGLVEVVWDRRVRDRRVIIQDVGHERRRGERRGNPGPMWHKLGFMVVRQHDGQNGGPTPDLRSPNRIFLNPLS